MIRVLSGSDARQAETADVGEGLMKPSRQKAQIHGAGLILDDGYDIHA